jgi:flagellar biosynthetic protein FlhB
MADNGSTGEMTEEPTPKRIKDARKKGQAWRSRDLTSVAVLLAATVALEGSVRHGWGELQALFAHAFGQLSQPPGPPGQVTGEALVLGLRALAVLSLPVAVTGGAVAVLIDFLQVRGVFSLDPLSPRLEKLNPVTGLKNMFSKRSVVELLKNVVKVSAAGTIAVWALRDRLGLVARAGRDGAGEVLAVTRSLVTTVVLWVCVFFVFAAAFDLWFQRRVYRKQLRMTKEEVRREHKEMEGDVHVRARRRQLRFELLAQAQTQAVRQADVLVTNPTHVAAALAYDIARDGAPRVIAKGVDALAEQMKRAAAEAGVPEIRDVPLARALLQVPIDEEIPERLYDAVAEILNLVYRARVRQAEESRAVGGGP